MKCKFSVFSILVMTMPTEEDALAEVYYLTNDITKNWRKLLKYSETLDVQLKRKILWVWPTEKCLWQINKILREYDISCVLSVGCGNGLLEWLLQQSLNLQIYGLEVDRQWWLSNYAIKSFIELNYIEDVSPENNKNFLQDCCFRNSWSFALMFCYFNNRTAFIHYLSLYKGNWIIIIGPKEKDVVYTDPLPLEPNFPKDAYFMWLLRSYVHIGQYDVLAVYEKCLIPI